MLRLTKTDYLQLGQTEIGSILMRAAAESSYVAKQQQQIDLLTKTAEQRYMELLQMHPDIVHRVAQKHLASYLGITPQSFSRIRRNIME
jgi:CRP-like cAMP-binding protein